MFYFHFEQSDIIIIIAALKWWSVIILIVVSEVWLFDSCGPWLLGKNFGKQFDFHLDWVAVAYKTYLGVLSVVLRPLRRILGRQALIHQSSSLCLIPRLPYLRLLDFDRHSNHHYHPMLPPLLFANQAQSELLNVHCGLSLGLAQHLAHLSSHSLCLSFSMSGIFCFQIP